MKLMNPVNHNLVLLIHYSPGSLTEEDFIRRLVSNSIHPEIFTRTHELAQRNRITRRQKKLLKAWRRKKLPAFNFLVGLN